MNLSTYVVLDLETGSAIPSTCVPLSLAAKAYHPRTLEPIPQASFYSLMRPKDDEWDRVEEGALRVNKLEIKELEKAPVREIAWKSFVDWLEQFKRGKGILDRPIPCGHNIRNFDLVIINRLCQEFGQVDKKGEQTIFNPRDSLDLKDMLLVWYENQSCLPNFRLDTLRLHFGLSAEGAHRADIDTEQTGELIMRFLKLHRKMFEKVPALKGTAA